MKQRLFWKILFAFWLTFFCIVPLLWVAFVVSSGGATPEQRVTHRVAAPLVATLAVAIEAQGLPGATRVRAALLPEDRDRVTIAAGERRAAPSQPSRSARDPGGRLFTITYHDEERRSALALLALPWQALVTGILAGVTFSVALAWYLTKPIAVLRGGFDRLAHGDLDVRLARRLGRRRDELADLAEHFDRMAAQLEQLVTARDRLLHDVSHELRSPLSRLQLAIGLARQDPARLQASLDRIEREGRRLDAMVQELLVLARIESGAEQVDTYFDAAAVAEAVVLDARYEAQGGTVVIDFTTDSLPQEVRPPVRGDAELFRRAIENVLRNALRFSPPAGQVRVAMALEAEPARWRLEVSDDGPGVADGEFDRLFEPFVRGDEAGSGLGLAIARRAVGTLRGTITAARHASGGLWIVIEVPTSRAIAT